ncbi:hypothetical protein K502DRAFT_322583 [Neoconidiobolus thromboides FSU 785]|nr:hypothetical protein K502DRAFT_322583 [Neoconidiobolus thromboides FSU 785]
MRLKDRKDVPEFYVTQTVVPEIHRLADEFLKAVDAKLPKLDEEPKEITESKDNNDKKVNSDKKGNEKKASDKKAKDKKANGDKKANDNKKGNDDKKINDEFIDEEEIITEVKKEELTLQFGHINIARKATLKQLCCVILPVDVKAIYQDYLLDSFQELIYKCHSCGVKIIYALNTRYLNKRYSKIYKDCYSIQSIGVPLKFQDLKEFQELDRVCSRLRYHYVMEFSKKSIYPNKYKQSPLWVAAYYGITCPNIIYQCLSHDRKQLLHRDYQYKCTPLEIAYRRNQTFFIRMFEKLIDKELPIDEEGEKEKLNQLVASYFSVNSNILCNENDKPRPLSFVPDPMNLKFINDNYSTSNIITLTGRMDSREISERFFRLYFYNQNLFNTLISKILPPHHRRLAWIVTRFALVSKDPATLVAALNYYNLRFSNVLYNHCNLITRSKTSSLFKPMSIINNNVVKEYDLSSETLLVLAAKMNLQDQVLIILIHILKIYSNKINYAFPFSSHMVLTNRAVTPYDDGRVNYKYLKDVLPMHYFNKRDSDGFNAIDYAVKFNMTYVIPWFVYYLGFSSGFGNPLTVSFDKPLFERPPFDKSSFDKPFSFL